MEFKGSFNKIRGLYRSRLEFLLLFSNNRVEIYETNGFSVSKFQVIDIFNNVKYINTDYRRFEILDQEEFYRIYFEDGNFKVYPWGKGAIYLYSHNRDDQWVIVDGYDLKFNEFAEDLVHYEINSAHDVEISAIKFDMVGGLATGDENGLVKVWKCERQGNCLFEIHDFSNPIRCLEFTNKCTYLIASDYTNIGIYDAKKGREVANIHGMNSNIKDIFIYSSYDEAKLIFVCYQDGKLRVWNPLDGYLIKEFDDFNYLKPAKSCNRIGAERRVVILSKDSVYSYDPVEILS